LHQLQHLGQSLYPFLNPRFSTHFLQIQRYRNPP